MALIISSPELEKKVREAAAQKGIPAEAYLLEVVNTTLPLTPSNAPSKGRCDTDKKIALERWATRFPTNVPPLPDDALHREDFYDDRGL